MTKWVLPEWCTYVIRRLQVYCKNIITGKVSIINLNKVRKFHRIIDRYRMAQLLMDN
jgi:hypothetical protein